MPGVVVDGADDHTSRPGRDASERSALEVAAVIAGFQVFHFAGMARGNPFRKMLEFGCVGGGRDACEIEACVLGRAFHQGCDFVDGDRHAA